MGICQSQQRQGKPLKVYIPGRSNSNTLKLETPVKQEKKTTRFAEQAKSQQNSPRHILRSSSDEDQKYSSQQFLRNPSSQQVFKLSRSGSSDSVKSNNSSPRGLIQQGVQFYSTNASKKYSLLHRKQQQKNPDSIFMQNNKSGNKVKFEVLQIENEDSIKYIYWLKKYQLDHSHIIKVLEVHQDNESYQVISEYFDGYKLSHLIHEELSEIVLANIADQMFQVLKYLKHKHLFHGNISINSWEYVFHGDQVFIKLVDIKSIAIKSENSLESIIYLQPDQLDSQEYTTERDVWATMICLYMLVKGGSPYQIHKKQLHDIHAIKHIIKHSHFHIDVQRFSQDCIDFFMCVLGKKHSKHRLSLNQIIENKWLITNKYQNIPIQTRLLQSMLEYKETTHFHRVILEIMIQEFHQETALQLQKMFVEFDSDADRILQRDELIKMYEQYTNETDIEDKITDFFQKHQLNGTQLEQFTFLSLAAPRQDLLTTSNIETIFYIFSNHKSVITAKQVTKYLNSPNEEFEEEFDKLATDYQITMEQFVAIMELIK